MGGRNSGGNARSTAPILSPAPATLSGYDLGGAGGYERPYSITRIMDRDGFSKMGTLGTLTLFIGTLHDLLKFAGDYTSASFHVSQSGGVTVTN